VTEHEVAEWAARHHANWSPTKHNAAIDSLKGVFKVAIDRGIIGTNPAAKLTRAQVRQKRLELPSSGQFKQIVKTAREGGASSAKGNGDLIEFLAYSGCPIKEAGRMWTNPPGEFGLNRERAVTADTSRSIPRWRIYSSGFEMASVGY
jgi:hypothetical protein